MKNTKRKLPTGWRWTSLGNTELITIIMGQSPPGETYNKEKNGLPFFQGCADFGNIYPEPTVWCSKPKKIAEPNDILLSVRAPVGPTNVAKEKCCIGRGLAALRSKEGLTYKYLKWILRKFEKQISYGGSGSIFNAIGKDEIKDIIFPLPTTLDDQIAIAEKLERKMAEIEKMRQAALSQKEAIAAMQGAILRDVFPYKAGDKLPEGWWWEKIKNHILDYQSGLACGDKSKHVGYPHLRMNNISKDFKIDLSLLWRIPASEIELNNYCVKQGDILFNNTNSAELVGKSCLFNLKGNDKFLFSNHLTRIRTNETLCSQYLLYWINVFWLRRHFEDNCDKWVNQAAARVEDLLFPLDIAFPPSIADQNAIATELERKMTEIEKMRRAADNQLEAIAALPGAVLRQAFDFEEEEAS